MILGKNYWEAVRLWDRGIEMNTADLFSFWCRLQSLFSAVLAQREEIFRTGMLGGRG